MRRGLSHRQAAALFNIRRFNFIGRWEQQYNQGGPDALSWGSRGRRRKMTKNAQLQIIDQCFVRLLFSRSSSGLSDLNVRWH
ncbi:helix-turn-helix domain-containing protein [Paraburkholderia tropica]|uniref:helix-turn-helix domain-containing protein n=1 Tax=Paraburkholderia tropica TaxID=92647 RepID=UPI003AFB0A9A